MFLDSNQIARILPQSYPFLMIDRVVDFKKGESLTAIKNITGNEWFFQGRCQSILRLTPSSLPDGVRSGFRPTSAENEAQDCSSWGSIFPETLLIEAAAQAAILFYRPEKL